MPLPKLKYSAILFLCMMFHLQTFAQNKTCDALIKKSRVAIDSKDYTKALEILSEAKAVAEKEDSPSDIFCALNGMGECYYYMLDYGEALRFALQAHEVAQKSLGHAEQTKSLNNIGMLYSIEKDFPKAKEYLLKAYNTTKQRKNFNETGHACLSLGGIAIQEDSIMLAREYYKEVISYAKDSPNLLINGKIGMAETDLLLGNPVVAREKAMSLLEDAKKLNRKNYTVGLLLIIAKSYFKEKQYDPAAKNAMEILERSDDPSLRKSTFTLLVDIYKDRNDHETALVYHDSLLATEKKLNDLNSGKLFETTKAKFELANYKSELALRDERMASERKIFFSLAAVLLAGIAIVILVLRQKKSIAERNHKIAELELEKRESQNLLLEKQMQEKEIQAQLEQEKLRSEIEARNRKLSAKALYLSGRNELIEQVVDSLTSIPGMSGSKEVADYVRSLKGYLKTDAEWDDFISYFEQVNPNFLKVLQEKHPALSFADIRFICYIYMNLDLKEISTILNITTEACKKRKQRIAKKMDIEADDLHAYIFGINS